MKALVLGVDAEKAVALGPEGPLMEEFWDNVRRYGLYALTVSTGALSAVFEPIFELLKNPISAVLILIILGGSFYILSQVVSSMNTDIDSISLILCFTCHGGHRYLVLLLQSIN